MKNLAFAFLALSAISFWSCTGESQQDTSQEEFADTIQAVEAETPIEVTGVAVDGAMNSVYLKVGEDTIEFTYPDLDSDHRDSWAINDTLTVRYFETADGDSVTDVINKADA